MTVKQLMEFLSVQPQDAKIVTLASDSGAGYNEADKAELIDVVHDPEMPGYEGEYHEPEEVRSKGPHKIVKVVRLW